MSYTSFADFLHSKYLERHQKNAQYSLRSFSRDIGISSGRLTNLLKGRDIPGDETVEKFFAIFNLAEEERLKLKKTIYSQKYLRRGTGFSKQLNEEEFNKISDWKTWSVFTMFQASDFQPSSLWFSEKLKLSVQEIEVCLNKILELGLIAIKDDFYELICDRVTTTNDVPSTAIRKFHKEFIPIGLKSLDKVKVDERDVSSLTFCIDKKMLPEYKKALAEFRAKLSQIAKQSVVSDELYQLNMQFFPVAFEGNNE
ncbi:TIGR02147 family protein [Peredibacter starrii]|uniref:TIGR02147 family protein n=1 Tax=Peredibacter starrii TaxID=28202 RepID=A0AAX4HRM3_9BACT|nr:TIGR02147 family protein [Peredibacter starrii]WPU65989.1 TIGR02147 family protein [Peredibacter starrii]